MTGLRSRRRLTAIAFLAGIPLGALGARGNEPARVVEELRKIVEILPLPIGGRVIHVSEGGDFQAALNAAKPGDVITLEAGATFAGSFVLPRKTGVGWIVVRSDAPEARLPPEGRRIDPSHAAALPKLVASSGAVLATARGAHHYRFVGVEIRPSPGVFLYDLVRLGNGETSEDDLPHDIIFDRCYVHGDPNRGARRGIAMNSAETALINSYVAGFKEAGSDSQAIAAWNGSGPFKIENNYLEAAGENVLFGGADPSIPGLVPSDIEIRRNHVAKPLSWKAGSPGSEDQKWTVKNLFELKNARRVLVEGNLFERNWLQSQNGFAILFTVRNQDGKAPWSVVSDVTFRSNVVRDSGSGVNLLGRDNTWPNGSQVTSRIRIENNLFDRIDAAAWGGDGRFLQVLAGVRDLSVQHNTVFQSGPITMAEGEPNPGFVFRDNIAPHNAYGVIGADTGIGLPTLERYFPDAVFTHDVIATAEDVVDHYPPENFFPFDLDEIGFVDRAGRDYRLSEKSEYRGRASDGTDIGADFKRLEEALGPDLWRQVR